MVQVYMHDYGMIGKYAIINTDDEAIAQEYKNYKAPTLEEFYVAHPEARRWRRRRISHDLATSRKKSIYLY